MLAGLGASGVEYSASFGGLTGATLHVAFFVEKWGGDL